MTVDTFNHARPSAREDAIITSPDVIDARSRWADVRRKRELAQGYRGPRGGGAA